MSVSSPEATLELGLVTHEAHGGLVGHVAQDRPTPTMDAAGRLALAGAALGGVRARDLDQAARIVVAGGVPDERQECGQGRIAEPPDPGPAASRSRSAQRQLDHARVELGDGTLRQRDPLRRETPAQRRGRGLGQLGHVPGHRVQAPSHPAQEAARMMSTQEGLETTGRQGRDRLRREARAQQRLEVRAMRSGEASSRPATRAERAHLLEASSPLDAPGIPGRDEHLDSGPGPLGQARLGETKLGGEVGDERGVAGVGLVTREVVELRAWATTKP